VRHVAMSIVIRHIDVMPLIMETSYGRHITTVTRSPPTTQEAIQQMPWAEWSYCIHGWQHFHQQFATHDALSLSLFSLSCVWGVSGVAMLGFVRPLMDSLRCRQAICTYTVVWPSGAARQWLEQAEAGKASG